MVQRVGWWVVVLAVAALFLGGSTPVRSARVAGFDLGDAYTKVGSVVDRTFQVVLNEASARRTPTALSLVGGTPEHGTDAVRFLARSPECTFKHFRDLLGRTRTHPAVEELWPMLPFRESLADTSSLNLPEGAMRFICSDIPGEKNSIMVSPTDILALFIDSLISAAPEGTDLRTSTLAVAVPLYYGPAERAAILAGFKALRLDVVGLINDGTAVALHYVVNRRDLAFPDGDDASRPRLVAFVDYGYSAAKATLVQFERVESRSGRASSSAASSKVPRMTVLASAWDTHTSGRAIDFLFAKFLLSRATAEGPKGAEFGEGEFQRLIAAAAQAKEVLSANAEVTVSVEALVPDYDLRLVISRAEFEAVVAPAISSSASVLADVLAKAGVQLEHVASVEIVGGLSRIPAINTYLADFVASRVPLDRHLDGNEAAVLGTTYYAAKLGSSMRVSEIDVRDMTYTAVMASLEVSEDLEDAEGDGVQETEAAAPAASSSSSSPSSAEGGEDDHVRSASDPLELFASGGRVGIRRSVARRTEGDSVKLRLTVRDAFSGSEYPWSECTTEKFQFRREFLKAEPRPKVKAYVHMNPSGVPVADRLDTEWRIAAAVPAAPAAESDAAAAAEGGDSDAAAEPPTVTYTTRPVPSDLKCKNFAELDTIGSAQGHVMHWSEKERRMHLVGQARNALEEQLYSWRDRMEEDYANLIMVATDDEVEALKQLLDESREWFDENGWDDGQFEEFGSRCAQIVQKTSEIDQRIKESREWRASVIDMRGKLDEYLRLTAKLDDPRLNRTNADVAAALRRLISAREGVDKLDGQLAAYEEQYADGIPRGPLDVRFAELHISAEYARLTLRRVEQMLNVIPAKKRFLRKEEEVPSTPTILSADHTSAVDDDDDPLHSTGGNDDYDDDGDDGNSHYDHGDGNNEENLENENLEDEVEDGDNDGTAGHDEL